nr:hypothetical protein [uncultured Desulfobulbus sp.]
MKRSFLLALVLLLLLLSMTEAALAHSNKGRKKMDLDLDRPTADNFAYFMESYVHRELYRGRNPKWENRYYVREFKNVDINGNQAVVDFIALDAKSNDTFDDSMTFVRGEDGVWQHQTPDGTRVTVYTYVPKLIYYSKKFSRIGPIVGVTGASAGILALVVLRRRRAAGKSAQNLNGADARELPGAELKGTGEFMDSNKNIS